MQDYLSLLSCDNPEVSIHISRFLDRHPAYQQALQTENECSRRLLSILDSEQTQLFLDYEAAANAVLATECWGHYLFGLGLRQDLREALLADRL